MPWKHAHPSRTLSHKQKPRTNISWRHRHFRDVFHTNHDIVFLMFTIYIKSHVPITCLSFSLMIPINTNRDRYHVLCYVYLPTGRYLYIYIYDKLENLITTGNLIGKKDKGEGQELNIQVACLHGKIVTRTQTGSKTLVIVWVGEPWPTAHISTEHHDDDDDKVDGSDMSISTSPLSVEKWTCPGCVFTR